MKQRTPLTEETSITSRSNPGFMFDNRFILRQLGASAYRLWTGADIKWINLYGLNIEQYATGKTCYKSDRIIGD